MGAVYRSLSLNSHIQLLRTVENNSWESIRCFPFADLMILLPS